MWGNYQTPNGNVFVVVDGASNHDGSKTGADVARLVHKRFRKEAGNLYRSGDLKDLIYSINKESSRVNEGAYAAIAGVLHRSANLYAFSAGDVAVIARKANKKLLQVMPLDLTMGEEEAKKRARSEIGQVVNNILITEENYTQRIRQYMNHGLSNALGMGEEFFIHEKYFDAKTDTVMLIASDGVTDPFMDPQSESGNILKDDAEKLYDLFSACSNAKECAAELETLIWDVQVDQKRKIKPDDRTAVFLYFNEDVKEEKQSNVNSMTNEKLVTELVKKLEGQKMAALDEDVRMSVSDLDRITEIAIELERKINK